MFLYFTIIYLNSTFLFIIFDFFRLFFIPILILIYSFIILYYFISCYIILYSVKLFYIICHIIFYFILFLDRMSCKFSDRMSCKFQVPFDIKDNGAEVLSFFLLLTATLYKTMLFTYKEYIDEGMIMIILMIIRDSFISSHSICLSYRLLLHTLHWFIYLAHMCIDLINTITMVTLCCICRMKMKMKWK